MNKDLRTILLAAGLLYLAFIIGTSFTVEGERYFTLVDDAMISMRYARHLAGGNGLVWNIGEKPVQGFTNLGWTLLMGALHLLPLPASMISLTVMFTSAAILLSNIYIVFKIADTLSPDSKHAPILAALVTAFYFPLVFWSLRGMEVGLLVMLINLALLLSLKNGNPLLISLILALVIIVRVDAVISALLIAVSIVMKHRSGASTLPLLAIIFTTLGLFLFQLAYFGDLLPTTYYQKVAGYTLWERARHGILVFNEFASRDTLALFLLAVTGLFIYQQRERSPWLLLVMFLAQCAYSIYVGGDYAEPETNAANRFITQGMPALFVLSSLTMSRLLSDLESIRPRSVLFHPRINPAIPVALMMLLVISGEPWFNYAVDKAPLLKADIRRVRLGVHIAENTSPEAVIAVHAAGQIPYFSDRRTIDLLGLNEPLVAKGPGQGEFYPGHNKWNYEYSIGQLKPDLIADNFAPLAEYVRGNDLYQKLDSDIYIRIDSPRINIEGLSNDFK